MIEHWGMGGCIAWDFSSVTEAVTKALDVDEARFREFLPEHTWEKTADWFAALLR